MEVKGVPTTLVGRLRADIAEFGEAMDYHLSRCVVKRREERIIPGVIVVLPPYYWERNDPTESVREMKLRQELLSWYEPFELLFSDAGEQLARDVAELKRRLIEWIERKHGFYVPSSIKEARENFRKQLDPAVQLLDSLCATVSVGTILVPDTNALCVEPDPNAYAMVAETESFEIKLMPTVLGELDKLKVEHRNPEFRQRAEKAIKRIKGLRTQGDITQGVTVNGSIRVRAIAKEPDFDRTLNWLDKDNFDDRIIAGALEIQRAEPAAAVILVTSDINLQTKATAAKLPFAEPPNVSSLPEANQKP